MNGTTARELLLASLLVGDDDKDGIYFDEDRYFDWSGAREDGRLVELGDVDGSANMEMTWSEIERLQRALTLLLLNRD